MANFDERRTSLPEAPLPDTDYASEDEAPECDMLTKMRWAVCIANLRDSGFLEIQRNARTAAGESASGSVSGGRMEEVRDSSSMIGTGVPETPSTGDTMVDWAGIEVAIERSAVRGNRTIGSSEVDIGDGTRSMAFETESVIVEDGVESEGEGSADKLTKIERLRKAAAEKAPVSEVEMAARVEMTSPRVVPAFLGAVGTSREPVITLNDFGEVANEGVVFSVAREEPGVLDAVIEARVSNDTILMDMEVEDILEGPRVTVVEEARLALARRPTFNAETYDPPLHLFVPSGLGGYTPQNVDYDAELVLRDRSSHLSSTMERSAKLDLHGAAAHSYAYYQKLPQRVRELVDAAGFGTFVTLLIKNKVDHQLLIALLERWWDTTNTFHFGFGEMTVTPLDFAAITGLRVGGAPIPFDSGIANDTAALTWFLGRVPSKRDGDMALYGQFVEYWDHEPATDMEAEQMARAYLLYLFGATLFPSRRNRVQLSFLAALRDLRSASRYDWGGVGLSILYTFLGVGSRGQGGSIAGYWRVLEIWAYEVVELFPPNNKHPKPSILPRSLRWKKPYSKHSDHRGNLQAFRFFLDDTSGRMTNWGIWDNLMADYLPRSQELTRSRVLLESPFGWQWYLGDRVSRQSMRTLSPLVPGPIPLRMTRTSTYTRAEIEQYTVPDLNLDQYFRHEMEYSIYRSRYLAPPLLTREQTEAQEVIRRVAQAAATTTRGGVGTRNGRGRTQTSAGRNVENGRGNVRRSEALPQLRFGIPLTMSNGTRVIIEVPELQNPQPFTGEVTQEWAQHAYELIQAQRDLICRLALGGQPTFLDRHATIPSHRPAGPTQQPTTVVPSTSIPRRRQRLRRRPRSPTLSPLTRNLRPRTGVSIRREVQEGEVEESSTSLDDSGDPDDPLFDDARAAGEENDDSELGGN